MWLVPKKLESTGADSLIENGGSRSIVDDTDSSTTNGSGSRLHHLHKRPKLQGPERLSLTQAEDSFQMEKYIIRIHFILFKGYSNYWNITYVTNILIQRVLKLSKSRVYYRILMEKLLK